MVTLTAAQPGQTRDGYDYVEAYRGLAGHSATIVGMNCDRGSASMLPLVARIPEAVDCPVAAQPLPYRTDANSPKAWTGSFRWPPSRSPALASRWRPSPGRRTTSGELRGHLLRRPPHHVRAMAEALGREVLASKYSPALELDPMFRDSVMARDAGFPEPWT